LNYELNIKALFTQRPAESAGYTEKTNRERRGKKGIKILRSLFDLFLGSRNVLLRILHVKKDLELQD
jgi:hypothetical protein